jgi:hypothetical protein
MLSNNEFRVPTFCPLCGMLMKGKSTNTFYDCGVCVSCAIQFVEGREERWRNGWRPSGQELSDYVESLKK